MPDITVRQVDKGLDATVEDPSELKRGSAADNSKNMLYSRGIIKIANGFAKAAEINLPIDNGNDVLGIFRHTELDGTEHTIAVTSGAIFDRNFERDLWDDITQAGQALAANILFPVSQATVLHTDGLPLNGSGDDWYQHSVICPGGVAPIQRWGGKFETDYADLLGADGYHDPASGETKHYALQVGIHYNHTILLSPRIADSNNNLHKNSQMVLWSRAGKLETWEGFGTGNFNLLDTGDNNVWSAPLGSSYIVYQGHSIWSLNHVGGSIVYDPRPEIPSLGLLAPHLLYSKNNVHYFVGNDYNVYSYEGGSALTRIGDKIHKFLQRDLEPTRVNRCYMVMGAQNSRLCIFIVPSGGQWITMAYYMDIRTGAWSKRDFTAKWSGSISGITTVALMGSGSYDSGSTYAEMVLTNKTAADMITEGTTSRQMIIETLTEERIMMGDSRGFVYQFETGHKTEDGETKLVRHITEVYDAGSPRNNKLWPGITINARGSGLIVGYRTSDFDTVDGGWTHSLVTLTDDDEWLDHEVTILDTSKKIQFSFSNYETGSPQLGNFEVSSYTIHQPVLEGTV
jgi:hypothetical protein